MSKILFVDDDDMICEVVQFALATKDLEITCVNSAYAAIDSMKNTKYDLVFTDLKMEGMDGTALCKHIGEHHPDIPVVLVTAYPSLHAAVVALDAGANDFLTKPFELDDIMATINSFTEKQYDDSAD